MDALKTLADSLEAATAAAKNLSTSTAPGTVKDLARDVHKAIKGLTEETRSLSDAMGADWKESQKSEWSGAYVNDLPDSAFLYVAPGGTKDADGKTTPRNLRHLPVRDADGNVDHAHVANALARIPTTQIPSDARARAKAEAEKLLSEAKP